MKTDLQKYIEFFDEMNIGYTRRVCGSYDENDERIYLIELRINDEHITFTDNGNYLNVMFNYDTEKFVGFQAWEEYK